MVSFCAVITYDAHGVAVHHVVHLLIVQILNSGQLYGFQPTSVTTKAVSYTHLDVYKRQPEAFVEVSTLPTAGVPPEILTVPLNILLPFTCIFAPGLLVPIPTFPFPRIRTTSVGAVLVVTLRFANTISLSLIHI